MTLLREDFLHHTTMTRLDRPVPTDKVAHLLRPPGGALRSSPTKIAMLGEDPRTLRTLCGLGLDDAAWRISIRGAATNVNGDGWSVCVACCLLSGQGRDAIARRDAAEARAEAERIAAIPPPRPRVGPLEACGGPTECGAPCCLAAGHRDSCEAACDKPGQPGSCPA